MNAEHQIIEYLRDHMPDYPFDPDLDDPFVHELVEDFVRVDVLEEIKAFRWYNDNRPTKRYRNLRTALRRWLANAWTRNHAGVA